MNRHLAVQHSHRRGLLSYPRPPMWLRTPLLVTMTLAVIVVTMLLLPKHPKSVTDGHFLESSLSKMAISLSSFPSSSSSSSRRSSSIIIGNIFPKCNIEVSIFGVVNRGNGNAGSRGNCKSIRSYARKKNRGNLGGGSGGSSSGDSGSSSSSTSSRGQGFGGSKGFRKSSSSSSHSARKGRTNSRSKEEKTASKSSSFIDDGMITVTPEIPHASDMPPEIPHNRGSEFDKMITGANVALWSIFYDEDGEISKGFEMAINNIFDEFDVNNDGAISELEFDALHRQTNGMAAPSGFFDECIDNLDSNEIGLTKKGLQDFYNLQASYHAEEVRRDFEKLGHWECLAEWAETQTPFQSSRFENGDDLDLLSFLTRTKAEEIYGDTNDVIDTTLDDVNPPPSKK